MMTPIRWRFLFIAVLLVAALFAILPLEQKINLELDLKGGIHLILQVRTEEAIARKVESDVETVRALLGDSSVPFDDAARVP